jgi:hypothetical protein
MKFKKFINEAKTVITYHGGNTILNPSKDIKYLVTKNSNNQEGIGYYFGPIETAQMYGKKIVQTEVDPKNFIGSRDDVSKHFKKISVLMLLTELHNTDNEPLYFLLTDWGKEIMEPEDVTRGDLMFLAKHYLNDEVRDFQIDLADKFGVATFVEIWNRIFKNIHGTYNKDLDWYCIINTKQIVTPV